MNLFEKTNYLLGEELNEATSGSRRSKETNTRGFNEPTENVAPSINKKVAKTRSFSSSHFTAELGELTYPESFFYGKTEYRKAPYKIGTGDDEKTVPSIDEKIQNLEDKTDAKDEKEARTAANALGKFKEQLKEQSKYYVPVEHLIALVGYNLRAYGANYLSGAPELINSLSKSQDKNDLVRFVIADLFSTERKNVLKDPVEVDDKRMVANYNLIYRLIKDSDFIKERFDRYDGMIEIMNSKAAEENNSGSSTRELINVITKELTSENIGDAETVKELIGEVPGAKYPELTVPEVNRKWNPATKNTKVSEKSPDRLTKNADSKYTLSAGAPGKVKFFESLDTDKFAGLSMTVGKYGATKQVADAITELSKIADPMERWEMLNSKLGLRPTGKRGLTFEATKDITCKFIISRVEEVHIFKNKEMASLVMKIKMKSPEGGEKTIIGETYVPFDGKNLPATGPKRAFLEKVFSTLPTGGQIDGLMTEAGPNITIPDSMIKFAKPTEAFTGTVLGLKHEAKQQARESSMGMKTSDVSFDTTVIELFKGK
jgi:hypothetical protein